ncbi:MAG: viperin family antiviral radical SAM protein [Leptospiraceae bacterium]|nr:viperin family antiviral radical SAM protein [Leptospiraceae bacterium]
MIRKNITVNFHLTRACNYKCKYCYAHFIGMNLLDLAQSQKIIEEIAKAGFGKINFAGGEPLTYKPLGHLIRLAKHLNLKTSIITNGSLLTKDWLKENVKFLDIIGISCDSSIESTQKILGRGNGSAVEKVKQAFSIIQEYNLNTDNPIFTKLNSVITSYNYKEDMTNFVLNLGINRWKIFQVLRIEGENDKDIENLAISNIEFQEFVNKHIPLKQYGIDVVAEDNDNMTNSYLMINPEGQFYQNASGNYIKSESIIKVGIESALEQISFQYSKFIDRGGAYPISNKNYQLEKI